uniref:BPTI/Kunitz inhibitor domain-containing protein n=1 Tax=Lates calcarifer TaxID=8187 RepID=A0A4W6ELI9_LATCA
CVCVCVCVCMSTGEAVGKESENRGEVEPNKSATPAALCQLPLEEGSCGRYTLRWYFNSQAQACRPFIYSGCEGNENRFVLLEECIECIRPNK